jgi:hypothetical protein
MGTKHTVKEGDCISSIAFAHGLFPDTIWDHPDNEGLRKVRKDPNVLLPGDILAIPDKRPREVSKATSQVHQFKLKNVPAYLNLVLRFGGDPLANQPYVLDVDGASSRGTTDAEGKVSLELIPNARKGKLTVGEPGRQLEFQLDLGHLDPIDQVIGFKKRLRNLGYTVGPLDDQLTAEFEDAIRCFEGDNHLTLTGAMGDENQAKLEEVYGR